MRHMRADVHSTGANTHRRASMHEVANMHAHPFEEILLKGSRKETIGSKRLQPGRHRHKPCLAKLRTMVVGIAHNIHALCNAKEGGREAVERK